MLLYSSNSASTSLTLTGKQNETIAGFKTNKTERWLKKKKWKITKTEKKIKEKLRMDEKKQIFTTIKIEILT